MTYDELVKDLIHDERQFIRDLNLIIKVFREPIVDLVSRKDLETIFSNIYDILDFAVSFLGSLEDAVEVAEENCQPFIGACFEETAENAEFNSFIKYANDVCDSACKDCIHRLLAMPHISSSLSKNGQNFLLSLKYVLPKLLLGPVYHCFSYFEYIKALKDLTKDEEDKEAFEQSEGLLQTLKSFLDQTVKRNSKIGDGYLR